MKNPISLFHSVVEFAHRIYSKNPSRDSNGAADEHSAEESLRDPLRQVIREEMREMLRELLSDPKSAARLLRPSIAGTALPFAGGTCAVGASSTENYIAKFLDTSCDVTNTNAPIYEDLSGHVGIGTTTPAFRLQLQLSDSAVDGMAIVAPEVNNYLHALLILSSRGPSTSPEVIQGGDYIWNFFGEGYDGTYYDVACAIGMLVEGTVSTGIVPGVISFSTANASGTVLERMRINSAGYVGIGTTAPAEMLDIAGAIRPQGLRMKITNASFATAAGTDVGSATFASGDGGMEADTGTTTGSYDETIGGLITYNNLSQMNGVTDSLDAAGAFLCTRARWNSATIGSADVFYILAGGLSSGNLRYAGFGFKAIYDATYGNNRLKGVVISSGSETVVDLGAALTSGTFLDMWAICRGGSVQFYLNGSLAGTANVAPPSSADSTYEAYVTNGSGTNNAVLQVAYLTVGFPF